MNIKQAIDEIDRLKTKEFRNIDVVSAMDMKALLISMHNDFDDELETNMHGYLPGLLKYGKLKVDKKYRVYIVEVL